ncbi:oxidoreductase [Brachybacterium phenoliresistens]|uniref:Oxidoreductase n=1 Tax=Brachybacterium phenoliresistens TaxID=396014 RepID=Z9JS09_9MICO|nr:Gfo/Idh/MocA family oxidoreductase [Brachybacterium phenoliresistens]EWS80989.1 oxidoreductase [Brachybacterium phenoliresistens]
MTSPSPAVPRPDHPLRVAVVGAGVIGAHHCRVIATTDGIELGAVVDVDLERAGALAAEHDAPAVGSLAEALAPEHAIDIVAVCTPSGLHAVLAIEAMEAGRHVLIEKPIDVVDERAARIDEARRAAGVQAAVISQHRFDAATEQVAAAIAAGRLGRVTSAVASVPWWRSQEYYDSGQWRGTLALDGGGALMNQGVHTVDLLCAFLGRPVEVFGYTALLAHEGIEVEDTAAGVIRFDGGALGLIHATTASFPGSGVRLQVHGDQGGATIESDRLIALTCRDADDAGADAGASDGTGGTRGTGGAAEAAAPAPDFAHAHRLQYEDLVRAIRTGGAVRVGTREARTALAVINGLYESARTGAPVAIPEF